MKKLTTEQVAPEASGATKVCSKCGQELPLDSFGKHKGRRDGRLEICRACRSEARRALYASSEEERFKVAERGKVYYNANKEIIAPKKAAYVQANREAHNARGRRWYHTNLEKARTLNREQVARYRQTDKAKTTARNYYLRNIERIRQYNRDNAQGIAKGKHLRYTLNKPAVLAQMKEYYEENKPYILARNRAYQRANPEIIRSAKRAYYYRNPGISRVKEMRRRVRLRQNGSQLITLETMHHIWYSQGGKCPYCQTPLGNSPADTSAYHLDHILPISRGGGNQTENIQCLCPPCNYRKGAKHPLDFAKELGILSDL